MGFCREFKLIDIDVCIGAVHEYRVNYFQKRREKKMLFLYRMLLLQLYLYRIIITNNFVH